MAQKVESRSRTFQVTAALKANRLVKLLASGKIDYAGAADVNAIGFTQKETFAADAWTAIDLINAEGTQIVEAHSAFAVGDQLYQAAAGRIDDAGTVKRGIALAAAAAQGDWVEMLVEREAVGAPVAEEINIDIALEVGGATDAMDVIITVQDGDLATIAAAHTLEVWISDAATGIGLTADTFSGALTAVSGAILSVLTATKHVIVTTAATGIIELRLVASANPADIYVAVKNPSTGQIHVSVISGTNWEGA